jgi:hypothetical protein
MLISRHRIFCYDVNICFAKGGQTSKDENTLIQQMNKYTCSLLDITTPPRDVGNLAILYENNLKDFDILRLLRE